MPAESILVGIVLFAAVAGAAYLLRPTRLRRLACEKAREAVATAAPLTTITDEDYLRASQVRQWLDRHPRYRRLALTRRARRRLARDPELQAAYDRVSGLYDRPWRWTAERNEAYVHARLDELDDWFATRLPYPLTDEQRRAVVTDEDNNLVVAGAGSGKTSAILGKLAYLMEQRGVPPTDILVLAFNSTVAAELRERIDSLGMPLPEVSTFHAKGFDILGKARGRKPAVSALAADRTALQRFLAERFAARMRERRYRRRFSKWWVERRVEASELKSETPDERLRKERSLGLRTLIGVQAQSQSEVKVGDWLTLRGIRWEHEPRYPHTPASTERRDYTPDFHLPDYDVWIEVWSCDKTEERFPPEIPKARYKEDMAWKRALHDACGTTLIEVFQNDVWGGRLGDRLTARLADVQVRTKDPSGEALEGLLASVEDSFPPFVGLLSSFLELFRSGGWTRDEVKRRAKGRRSREFLELFWPLLDDYEEALRLEGKIDFGEMLLGASEAMEGGYEPPAYRYILVDEFQDVSRARLELVRHLRGSAADCRTFLVGDDWQSIYRFAGSDVSYFTGAPEYLGATARTDLARTFRLTPDVAALSSRFITRNPAQLDKRIIPREAGLDGPSVVLRLYDVSEARALQEVLEEIGRAETGRARVLVLGRYNHTLHALDELPFQVPENVALQPLTVHRAKGLEGDHVVVLGLDSGRYGFPSEIEDDPVLRLLLANEEAFPNAEERRLFYVALTRARSRVYLFAPAQDPSSFVQELLEADYAAWIGSSREWSAGYRCPRCRGRTIRRKEGPSGSFWGCTNYPACHGVLPVCFECGAGILEPRTGERGVLLAYTCSECQQEAAVCPGCGVGALVRRNGPRGPFMGCSEWRWEGKGCGYTRGMAEARTSS
jgi:DNA helicase IV